jgi:hypothetical protein
MLHYVVGLSRRKTSPEARIQVRKDIPIPNKRGIPS